MLTARIVKHQLQNHMTIGAISQAITDREVRLEEEKAKAKQPETAASAATTKARPKLPNF